VKNIFGAEPKQLNETSDWSGDTGAPASLFSHSKFSILFWVDQNPDSDRRNQPLPQIFDENMQIIDYDFDFFFPYFMTHPELRITNYGRPWWSRINQSREFCLPRESYYIV